MTVPGGDAGLLLNCLRNSMPGIVLPLTNILSHMALCLRVAGSGVNLNEVFSPGCKNNISMLTRNIFSDILNNGKCGHNF